MHEIELHRRAQKGLKKMPPKRRDQITEALEEMAKMEKPADHPNVDRMKGNMSEFHRMRIGGYRAIFEIVESSKGTEIKLLFVLDVGPRGGIYKK